MEGWPELLGVWVDLETELGEVGGLFGVLDETGRKREKSCRISVEEEGFWVASGLRIALYLPDDKRQGRRSRVLVLSGLEAASAGYGF